MFRQGWTGIMLHNGHWNSGSYDEGYDDRWNDGYWPHGYWPHGFWPHGHFPHGHYPHGHSPHGHSPHAHWPHDHYPHGHSPHGHWAHGHDPHGHNPHGHNLQRSESSPLKKSSVLTREAFEAAKAKAISIKAATEKAGTTAETTAETKAGTQADAACSQSQEVRTRVDQRNEEQPTVTQANEEVTKSAAVAEMRNAVFGATLAGGRTKPQQLDESREEQSAVSINQNPCEPDAFASLQTIPSGWELSTPNQSPGERGTPPIVPIRSSTRPKTATSFFEAAPASWRPSKKPRVAPHASGEFSNFAVCDQVLSRWHAAQNHIKWFCGHIRHINDDRSMTILYHDGDQEQAVHPKHVMAAPHVSPLHAYGSQADAAAAVRHSNAAFAASVLAPGSQANPASGRSSSAAAELQGTAVHAAVETTVVDGIAFYASEAHSTALGGALYDSLGLS